jgi:UDP-N-acetylmuramoylalanine-D-glutamate ligase
VCIGTFGLRGSVNYDNAAAAVDAADLIVTRLRALGNVVCIALFTVWVHRTEQLSWLERV